MMNSEACGFRSSLHVTAKFVKCETLLTLSKKKKNGLSLLIHWHRLLLLTGTIVSSQITVFLSSFLDMVHAASNNISFLLGACDDTSNFT